MNRRKIFLTIGFSVIGVILLVLVIFLIFSNIGQMNKIESTISEAYGQQSPSSGENIDSKTDVDTEEIIAEENIDSIQNLEDEVLGEDIRMFLFLGIDRTVERDQQYSIYRADSISVLRIDLVNSWAKVLSIPRDTYTYLPITNKNDKINHAYAFGTLKGRAEASMLEAVNLLLGEEEMRKYFTLEMEPIATIVNQIGGVWIDVEIDMKSHGVDLSKGYQKLNGDDAFDYVHWRYSSDGDIGRIRRQQQFAIALLKKLSEEYQNNDLSKFFLSNSEYTNTNIHVTELEEVTEALSQIDDIEFETLEGKSLKIDGIYYWQVDEESFEDTIRWFYDNNEQK